MKQYTQVTELFSESFQVIRVITNVNGRLAYSYYLAFNGEKVAKINIFACERRSLSNYGRFIPTGCFSDTTGLPEVNKNNASLGIVQGKE